MNSRPDLERLLLRYLDGTLSRGEVTELESWLRSDADARALLRAVSEQAVAMGDLARERGLRRPVAALEQRVVHGRFASARWLALAALLVLAGFLAAFWLVEGNRAVVEVEEVTGALNWTSPTGEMRVGLEGRVGLRAGTFETAGEGAMAQLRFSDGTRVTLGSSTKVALADDGQKQVRLLAGSLTFEVVPQPTGRPMMVRTPTATLEVLGTVFSVAASDEQTTLRVAEGRVRLRRLTDGDMVEVASRQTVVAALEQTRSLKTSDGCTPPVSWRRTFEQPPPAHCKGEWHPASEAEPAFVRAVPCVAGQRADGMSVRHFGVTARGEGAHLVTLVPDSVVRLRWRTAQPAALRVMLTVLKPDGRFGGNFETSLASNSAPPGSDGWRSAALPVSSFRPLVAKHPTPPERGQVCLVFVTTYEKPAGLEVAELAIEPIQP
jgi:ferric-dicitrate binding protein FerR (iron transport regulator)